MLSCVYNFYGFILFLYTRPNNIKKKKNGTLYILEHFPEKFPKKQSFHLYPLACSFAHYQYLALVQDIGYNQRVSIDTLLLTEAHCLHWGLLFVLYVLWMSIPLSSDKTHMLEIPIILTISFCLPNSCCLSFLVKEKHFLVLMSCQK